MISQQGLPNEILYAIVRVHGRGREATMALLNQRIQVYGKLGDLFEKLREGQAPDKFTREFLSDLGFKSSNWHAAINLFKGLGFLSSDGSPTEQYKELLDETRWSAALARAVKDAYSDIFVMKREPSQSDLGMIIGKYKSTHNLSKLTADRAARTFLALLDLSDASVIKSEDSVGADGAESEVESEQPPPVDPLPTAGVKPGLLGLSYNIQIHLPATKDVEVYNAIFKSLREHVVE